MPDVPSRPKIYHITHLRNLAQIILARQLWSDAQRIQRGLVCDVVGMSHIKRRRLVEIEVDCHPGTHVGDYVPFYFCPRSIMLFILHKGNHPDLNYAEGEEPIIHLQADLHIVVEWAEKEKRRWAFSDRNAGARFVGFSKTLSKLTELNWEAINSNQWSDPTVKEAKQAEFLVYESFPWNLVEQIGVYNDDVLTQVQKVMADVKHRPLASVQFGWYY